MSGNYVKAADPDYDLSVIITWPATRQSAPDVWPAIPSWMITITDGDTGDQITTVSDMTIHCDVTRNVWAEAVMFCTPDGRPILNGDVAMPPCYDTFRLQVLGMRADEQHALDEFIEHFCAGLKLPPGR